MRKSFRGLVMTKLGTHPMSAPSPVKQKSLPCIEGHEMNALLKSLKLNAMKRIKSFVLAR